MEINIKEIIEVVSGIAGIGSFFIALTIKNEVKQINKNISITQKNIGKVDQDHSGKGDNRVNL